MQKKIRSEIATHPTFDISQLDWVGDGAIDFEDGIAAINGRGGCNVGGTVADAGRLSVLEAAVLETVRRYWSKSGGGCGFAGRGFLFGGPQGGAYGVIHVLHILIDLSLGQRRVDGVGDGRRDCGQKGCTVNGPFDQLGRVDPGGAGAGGLLSILPEIGFLLGRERRVDGGSSSTLGGGGGRHGGPGLLLGTAHVGGGGKVDGRSSGTPPLLLLDLLLLLLFEVVEMDGWLDRWECVGQFRHREMWTTRVMRK